LPRGGILSWRQSAEELDAAVRACEFGPHRNEFGTVKLGVGREFAVVRELDVCAEPSTAPAGTVICLCADEMTVATTTRDVRFKRLTTLEGIPLAMAELANRWGIRSGHRFSDVNPARAEAATLACEAACRREGFWVERLSALVPIELPLGNVGLHASTQWHDFAVPIPAQLDRAAAKIASPMQRGAWLLAAFIIFLTRITGEEDFDVELGYGRDPGVEPDDLRARFVPFRAPALGSRRTFAEVYEDVACELKRTSGHNTYLRDVWIRYPELRRALSLAQGLPVAVEFVETIGPAPAPRRGTTLLMQIPRRGDACRWLVSNEAVGDAAAPLCARFAAFLESAVDATQVTRIPLLSEDERRRVLVEWNDTAVAFPAGKCAHQLFTEQARYRPEQPAVACEGRTLSYQELDLRSSQLAAFLGCRGIGAGSLVGIYLERSLELVVSLLAIMKTGAGYVPLDPIHPPDRIAYILADAGVRLLITQASLQRNVRDCAVPVLALDQSRDAITAMSREPYDRATADDIAYVIYTSGSTGRPKGVVVRHRSLTNLLCAMARILGFDSHDKLLAVTTLCFDIAALELLLPLVSGGQVEVTAKHVAGSGLELRKRLERSRPTVMQATPATWRMLIAVGWTGDPNLKVLCGGEPLPDDLARELLARAKHVWNLFGPTETTIWSSAALVEPDRPITIGRPIANTQFYVLDKWLQPVPPGIPGELHIGGLGVADGYLGRPEVTREKFIPNPFGGVDAGVLHKTGDLVRHLGDGRIEHLRRLDNQIKLNGYRVELGEIEAMLRTHPAVRDGVVGLSTEINGPAQLIAYVTLKKPDEELSDVELRDHLQTELPQYMVPETFVTVECIPLTANGKVDRKALPQAVLARPFSGSARTTSGAALEQAVAAIWQHVLRRKQVSLDDNFFDLGGTSLLFARVWNRLRSEFHEALAASDMYKYPTIRTMAKHLNRARRKPDAFPGDAVGLREIARP
jgi:amino acid adenylation domain-containing protein